MSRSKKKNPVVKTSGDSRYGKKQANKRVRQTSGIDSGGAYKKVYEQWNICDNAREFFVPSQWDIDNGYVERSFRK
jgi:hypothetical protein